MAEKVARLVPGVDVRKFKLDPMDGFLLTRINGKLGVKELSRETGLPDFSVERALDKLEKLGVIERFDPNAPPPPREQPRSALAQFSEGLVAAKYDPKELDEPADIAPEQKKRILDFYYRLEDLDHYTLLGVTKEADKKTVKRSYFELASVFHPDRYYKKDLGNFKLKMEVLFARITEAHDTLIDPEKRIEYDAYLAEVATTRGMEAMLERALAESRAAEAAAARDPSQPPGPGSLIPGPVAPTGPSEAEIRARKEALARRLMGGNPMRGQQQSRPPSQRPHHQSYASAQDAMDAIKRRYEQRVENATAAQAKKYVQAADEALVKGDVVAAASALNIATKFAPEDADLAIRYQEVKNKADELLSESYLKQAQYEERQGHWPDAARSWARVAKIKVGDARAHERTAHAILRAEGDLHEAAEHAKQAITLNPQAVENHVTLVEIYTKAGLSASARRAADVAVQIDPKHPQLVALLKKIGQK